MPHDFPYYEKDGFRYPRLTRILSILRDPDVEDWTAEVGTASAKRRQTSSQRRGTTLHKMISQTLLTSKEVKLPKGATFELRMCWQAWLRWYHLHQATLKPQSVEIPYVSNTHGYGCTPDLVEAGCITDWKTGSRLQAKHWIQVHAQVPLVFGIGTNVKVRLVRLDPAIGDFEEPVRPFDMKVWETFMNLKQVYLDWYAGDMQPKGERNGRR